MYTRLLILIGLICFYLITSEAAVARLHRRHILGSSNSGVLIKFGERQESVAANGGIANLEAASGLGEPANPNPPLPAAADDGSTFQEQASSDPTDCAKKVQADKPEDPIGQFLECIRGAR